MTVSVAPDDIAVYLGLDAVDQERLEMLIDDAVAQALSVVTVGDVDADTGPTVENLPNGAAAVIRAAVARIYLNPTGVGQEAVGPYSYSRSAGTGAMFSKAERGQLRRLAGRGSTYSIDTLAGWPGTNVPPWDTNTATGTVSTS